VAASHGGCSSDWELPHWATVDLCGGYSGHESSARRELTFRSGKMTLEAVINRMG
jgi:hypothetical protein